LGTNIGFGIRPEVMSILKKRLRPSKSGLAREICRGRANGTFMVTAWMLYLVSPEISGNYYVFAYAGDFPRRDEKVRSYSRKVLRDRIVQAKMRAIDYLRPEVKFKIENLSRTGWKRTVPVNASKDTRLREYDIPIIGHGNRVLIPTNWAEFAQIHREEMYRLKSNFIAQLPSLLIQGRIMRELFSGQNEFEEQLVDPLEIWERLKEVLETQHEETRFAYKDDVESVDQSMASTLAEEAKVAFLAFCIVDFRLKYDLQKSAVVTGKDSNHERKRKRQEMSKFT